MDTMQFQTVLTARVPRTNCPQCSVKTCDVPWAEPHSCFTSMFEAFAVHVLLASATVEQAKAAWLEAAEQSDKPIPLPGYRPVIYEAG